MTRGQIKYWNSFRAFGFIAVDDLGPDLFVHAKQCHLSPGEEPAVGDIVEFDRDMPADGRSRAANVRFPARGVSAAQVEPPLGDRIDKEYQRRERREQAERLWRTARR